MSYIDKYTQQRQDDSPDANESWLKFSTAAGFTIILFVESFVIVGLMVVNMIVYCTLKEWALKSENFAEENEYLIPSNE